MGDREKFFPRLLLVLFVLGILIYSVSLYFIVPYGFFSSIFLGLFGFFVVGALLTLLIIERSGASLLFFVASLCIWVLWLVLPTHELGVWARFYAEKTEYDFAVDQLNFGSELDCLAKKACRVDQGPPLLIAFP